MTRASWDEYFMSIAQQVATRATCDRKHVGAVIVKDRFILSTGYNGSIPGLPHCDEVGHLMEDGHCVRTVHAEANAICQAARNGVRIDGGTIYVTASPCFPCFKLCASAGIKAIVYGEFYRDERIFEFAQAAGIELRGCDRFSSMVAEAGELPTTVLVGGDFVGPIVKNALAVQRAYDDRRSAAAQQDWLIELIDSCRRYRSSWSKPESVGEANR